MCIFCCNFAPEFCSNRVKRKLFILFYSLCVQVLCAQVTLVLPYDATGLTDEQKGMNPDRLAYPTELKETIKNEVSFACTTEIPDLGPFSVSETTKVMFSPGNLQYQASTKTWRFAENQWEVIGEDNQNISDSYIGWIDLFAWGTGDNPTKSSTSSSNYSTFIDWGVNAISNGGNKANMWRTLTMDEWEYLFQTRAEAVNKYGAAKVNGITGVILLPDNWILPSGCGFTAGMTTAWDNWNLVASTNIYDANQWSKMEKAGAVFLPAAGWRPLNDGGVDFVGLYGDYWSSTSGGSEGGGRLLFDSGEVRVNFGYYQGGHSVRLVR